MPTWRRRKKNFPAYSLTYRIFRPVTLNHGHDGRDQWSSPPLQGNQAMTIVTKSALAAAILAVMAVSAQAQQGPNRQIQVLPAPGQQAQAQSPASAAQASVIQTNGGQPETAPKAEAPVADAAPAPSPSPGPEAAPQVQPRIAPAPKFAEPKFIDKPARKAFGYAGHRAPNCH